MTLSLFFYIAAAMFACLVGLAAYNRNIVGVTWVGTFTASLAIIGWILS